MNTMIRHSVMAIALSCLFLIPSLHSAFAADKEGITGWEIGSEYNDLYNAKELDKIRGQITKFVKITPLPGMAPGTAFYFDEGDGKPFLVHLCPTAYASPQKTGLRRGVKTKIRGSWTVIDDEDVFLASKVKQGEHFSFKVRLTSDGTPFWTMSEEELARELASN